jgi:hypothetical protein
MGFTVYHNIPNYYDKQSMRLQLQYNSQNLDF